MEKTYPKIGDQLYLQQRTGSYYVDMVKRPYTVIGLEQGKVQIQECKLIYPIFQANPRWGESQKDYYKDMVGKRVCFYDTVAESIEPNPDGRILELNWAPKKGMWQVDEHKSGYPQFAYFGKYEHQPYLD